MSNTQHEKNQNKLAKYKAKELTIKFSRNENLTDKEMLRSQNAIKEGGIALNGGRTMVSKKHIPTLLCTDKKGANIFYGELDEEDKFEDGNEKYASSSSVTKEISERIQEPRDALVRERLKYNESCINAFRDADELQSRRSIEEARIRKELPGIGNKVLKDRKISECEVSGEKFNNDAEAHHIERKSDNPRRALDPNNIAMVKKDVHKDIHRSNAEGVEEFNKYKERKKK